MLISNKNRDEKVSFPKAVVVPALQAALDLLPKDELLQFDRILERKLYDIDRSEIHEYTDGSDDGFLYCRGFGIGIVAAKLWGRLAYACLNRPASNVSSLMGYALFALAMPVTSLIISIAIPEFILAHS